MKNFFFGRAQIFIILFFLSFSYSFSQKVNETHINLSDSISEEILMFMEDYLMDSLNYSLREDSFSILTDTLVIETQVYSKKLLWIIPLKQVDTTIFMNHVFFYDLKDNPRKINMKSFAYIGSLEKDTLVSDYNYRVRNKAKAHSKDVRNSVHDALKRYLEDK